MVCHWAQELLGYHFTIVHRSKNMMIYVDAITQSFGHLISHHVAIAALLVSHDRSKSPCAYTNTEFSNLGNIKVTETDNPSSDPPPFLTSDVLHRFSQDITTNSATAYSLDPSSSPSIKTLPIQVRPSPNLCAFSTLHYSVTPNTAMATLQTHQLLKI